MAKPGFLTDITTSPVTTLLRWLRANKTRRVATVFALLVPTAFFGWDLNRILAVEQWLFWTYLRLWGLLGLFGVASFAVGWRALAALLPAPPKLLERTALAFALGVLIFYLSVYVGGLFGLYQKGFFFAVPLVLTAIGAPKCLTDVRRIFRHLKHRNVRLFAPRGVVELVTAGFLLVALLLVYVPILVPNNISYDAIWYHLGIAEDYAAAGRLHPFREGWFLGAYPHLSSILYTWAFIGPGALHERVLLCGHIEFSLLLGTLVSVSALASKLAKQRLPYAAAA
jgi:uncharacterized membrane protein YiaA